MTLELDTIEINCIIGDRPEERATPQSIAVSLSLEIPDTAADTDDLADTVDYAALVDAVRRALVAAKCRLIERAAKVAATAALAFPVVTAVSATVTKAGAIPDLHAARATYVQRRR